MTLTGWKTFAGLLLGLSVPEFPHMHNDDNQGTHFTELPEGFKELIHVKSLDEFLVPHKDAIGVLVIP